MIVLEMNPGVSGTVRGGQTVLPVLLCALLALTGSLVPTAGNAAQYDVELIVFKHLYPDSGGELLRDDPGMPEDWHAQPPDSGNFRKLPASQFRMSNIEGALSRSRNYRPLLHIAWRQPGFGRASAQPVLIRRDGPASAGQEITGTITLSRARYLHLTADLLFGSGSSPDVAEGAAPVRLLEKRRMRSREIHYLDNPYYGILVLVTPSQ